MTISPASLNEYNAAELPARELLEKLGWEYVPRETLAGKRNNEREVLLKDRLRRALLRLNPGLTENEADRAIFNLENIDATGIARNERVHEYLTYGMPLNVPGTGNRPTRIVRFFDFDNPATGLNEFVVTTQFRVRRGTDRGSDDDDSRVIKPDLALFVNGIPLVVMEAKSPTLGTEWLYKAVRQLRRYQEAGPEWHGTGAPELFYYNLFCVAHCGAAARFAAPGAPENAYFEWKSVLPYSDDEARRQLGEEPQGQTQLIIGLLSPTTLLDILRDYVVFEAERGRTIKKLPRYQQYRAVRAAVDRMLRNEKPEERGGVVWHTQGSGKSLTMLWLATKLRREPRLRNPTILVVTDRTQLDRQITSTFERSGFPAPEQADSSRDLRRLLTTGQSRTIMTTIQKFEEVLGEGSEHDILNASPDIIVMVDEAHRTQYGILAARMSKALPNASLVGFTGTPIDHGFRRSTMRRFGSLIDSYTIPQSVADGATVPIHYEARLPDLSIEGAETLDRLYDAMFGKEPAVVQAELRRRYANKQTVTQAEQRIQMIALDIRDHFDNKVRPNGFKAQVVAPSRAAAMRYYQHLKSFGISAYPIITTNNNDGPEFRDARELNQAAITSAFVDPESEPEILVVVDMLLTGFDAPPEQVLYLDRSLKEHSLLQAIARVNRRFTHVVDGVPTEKTHGLIVDYYGVSANLEDALATFDWPDVQEAMTETEEDPAPVIESVAVQAESHFKGRNLSNVWDCVAVFAPDVDTDGDYKADVYERFNMDYRQFSRLLDRFMPDPRALPYVDRLARLTEIRSYARAQFLREDANVDWTEIGAKVKKLVDERIDADVRHLMTPVSTLDGDFEQKIAGLPHDPARASIMEHAIRAHIHEKLAENPVFFERLSDKLSRIIAEMRKGVIDSAEACRQMAALRQEARSEAEIAQEHGLTPTSFAIYELLEGKSQGSSEDNGLREEQASYRTSFDESTKRTAIKVAEVIESHMKVVDWQSNQEVHREMRRDIKDELRNSPDYSGIDLDDLARRLVEMAMNRNAR